MMIFLWSILLLIGSSFWLDVVVGCYLSVGTRYWSFVWSIKSVRSLQLGYRRELRPTCSPSLLGYVGVHRTWLSSERVISRRELFAVSENNHNHDGEQYQDSDLSEGLRLNKVLRATHSRRQADALIQAGRVTVNGQLPTTLGQRCWPGDVIRLDGSIIRDWYVAPVSSAQNSGPDRVLLDDDMLKKNGHQQQQVERQQERTHEYIKYWKPLGVTCTTDDRVRNNVINAFRASVQSTQDSSPHHKKELRPPSERVFPVGRLDKETSGLLLLTSDGRLPNAALRGAAKQPKTYRVTVDRPLQEDHAQQLEEGVVITTEVVRDGERKLLRGLTRPARLEFVWPSANSYSSSPPYTEFLLTITEGRNRQVRKMLSALGYHVVVLTRIDFMGITLSGLSGPGDWKRLDSVEMALIRDAILRSDEAS